jgi:cysteine desulfurase / selenocysteine lyase
LKTSFPIKQVRDDFPILNKKVYGTQLVYFDNAASTQKPKQVIKAITDYYEQDNCNIHRGLHYLSQKATEVYEQTRKEVQQFIHAPSSYEIIFTRGTTESINLVASSFGKMILKKDDEVLISVLEHHSNFVPWQMLCEGKGAKLKFIPLQEDGSLNMIKFMAMVTKKTKLIAVSHVSNVLGTINPVKEIIQYAHEHGIPVLVDGAQAVSHLPVNVEDLDCDFYCFSGHKMYAPMGIGVLYGKEKHLEKMPPYQTGGEMIKEVFFDHSTFSDLPLKFEAGTPNVEGVYGLNAAIKYLKDLGIHRIASYENDLLNYATDRLTSLGDVIIIGTSPEKTSLISFLVGKIHPSDSGIIFDKLGIAVRTGHHCAMPLMEWYKIAGTVRASFAFYNTQEEIDRLVAAIITVKQMFA